MANGNNGRIKSMERQRDLQHELGAMLDRFFVAGLTAEEINEVLSAESELWEHRKSRDMDDVFRQLPADPHQRPHPPIEIFGKPTEPPPGA